MIAAAGPASTVRRPATCRPRKRNWFVRPSTTAIPTPPRLSVRRLPVNAASTSAPTDARPAATHSGGASSSAMRWTTNIRPQITHRTDARRRVFSNHRRHPVALTPVALPTAATAAPSSALEPAVRGEPGEHVVVGQRAHEAPVATVDVAGEPQRVEHRLLGRLDGAGEEGVEGLVGQERRRRTARRERHEDLAAAVMRDRAGPCEPETRAAREALELRGA